MERLQCFGLLADTEELNRFASDIANGERRTATGVTVHFGQYNTRQR